MKKTTNLYSGFKREEIKKENIVVSIDGVPVNPMSFEISPQGSIEFKTPIAKGKKVMLTYDYEGN